MPILGTTDRQGAAGKPAIRRRGRCAALLALWLVSGLWPGASRPAQAALNPADPDVVAEAFRVAGRGEWPRAIALLEPVGDPLVMKALRWLRMIEQGEPAHFATLADFLLSHPHWPMAERLQVIVEGTITDPADHELIRRFFGARPPLTTRGHIRYAQALARIGEDEAATALLRKAWVEGDFSPREEQRFLALYARLLSQADHVARLDNLLWDERRRSAERLLPRVPTAERRLAEARLRLQRRQNRLDQAIEAVPARLRDHPGLVFDRLRWRRQHRQQDGVIELLLNPPAELGRPGRWWFERQLEIRRALRARDFDLAYRLVSRHGQTAGDAFAEAEWLAGWLALRFERQPGTAFRHFARMYDGVTGPISQSRAAYWAGRGAAALGDDALARQWYQAAARQHITYYGQLAAGELGLPLEPLPTPPAPSAEQRAAFEGKELVRLVHLLLEVGAYDRLAPFLIQLAGEAESPTEVGMVADLAARSGLPHLVTQVGRYAAYYGQLNEAAAFPVPAIDGLLRPPGGQPEPALLLGVARQESIFNTWVISRAGARGILQLMPQTAQLMSRALGLPHNLGLLTGDPDHNVRLGSHYMRTLLERYGTTELAAAAYNAGPSRVEEWLRLHGDPRRGDHHDLVDWVELIPFDETRNYVQRVIEGRNMYRRRLAEAEPVTVWFRPVNGPLDPLPAPALKPRPGAGESELAELVTEEPTPIEPEAGPRVDPPQPALKPIEPEAGPVIPASFENPPLPKLKSRLEGSPDGRRTGPPQPRLKPATVAVSADSPPPRPQLKPGPGP